MKCQKQDNLNIGLSLPAHFVSSVLALPSHFTSPSPQVQEHRVPLPPIIAFLSCRFKSLMFTYFSISGTNNRPLHTDYFGSLYVSIMYVCPTDITASSLSAFCSSENLFSIANNCFILHFLGAKRPQQVTLSVRSFYVRVYVHVYKYVK